MPFLIVPNDVKTSEALIWVAIINEPDDPVSLVLRLNGNDVPIPSAWSNYTTESAKNRINYQFVNVGGLAPKTTYIIELFRGNDLVASGNVRTLPEELPFMDGKPFTVLLSSCFCSSRGESSAIGNTYLGMLTQDRPDIKILCGDQVYLDDPALHFTFNIHSKAELEDMLFANYARTWNQTGFGTGNLQFLRNGANFFTADDHEFWNNAPNAATLIPDTYSQGGRDEWWSIASNLLRIFQTNKTVTKFDVGPLSFFISDTRVNRGPGTKDFMSAANRNELEAWVNGLRGLGILVIGQPIFSTKAGFFASRFADKNLPNYKQYEDIARILSRTRKSIIVLTGDVHYGRIASCQLGPGIFLYEIIASPSALVNPAVGGKWDPPPEKFPAFGIDGVVKRNIQPNTNYRLSKNHFLTLSFFRQGAGITVRLKSIEISGNGQAPVPLELAKLEFFLGA